MGRCLKCGSRVFFIDETSTHIEVDGELLKSYPGDLHNRTCVRCTYQELYEEYRHIDEVK